MKTSKKLTSSKGVFGIRTRKVITKKKKKRNKKYKAGNELSHGIS
jgi:hypothetical protein